MSPTRPSQARLCRHLEGDAGDAAAGIRGTRPRTGAARVFVKPESLQWAGSFKVRGAYWRLKQLSPDEAKKGVVAYSSGNFAQGLAAAGEALGIPVTIVMPIDAPAAKRDATAGYGARVVVTDHGERRARGSGVRKGAPDRRRGRPALLHPFDDPEIVAGQAGAGLEALDQLAAKGAKADLLFCAVGGGGLIGGVALAFHYLSPATEIIGVEPAGFNGMGTSLAHGADRDHAARRRIDLRRADGAAAGRRALRGGAGGRRARASPSPTPRCARP